MLPARASWGASSLVAVAWVLAAGCGTSGEVGEPSSAEECPAVEVNGGGGIPDPPDGAAFCPEGACNYQTQSGCGDDQACRPTYTADQSDVTPGCQPVGDGKTGDACSEWTDCARGYLCAVGQCRKICCGGDWSACDAGESCIRQLKVEVNGEPIDSGAHLCFPVGTCDVLDPEACDDEPGRDCKLVDPTGAEACAPKSPEKLGEACSGPSVCERGLTCVAGECRRLCRAEACGEPACPPEEGKCVHFDRDPPGVGECTPGWD